MHQCKFTNIYTPTVYILSTATGICLNTSYLSKILEHFKLEYRAGLAFNCSASTKPKQSCWFNHFQRPSEDIGTQSVTIQRPTMQHTTSVTVTEFAEQLKENTRKGTRRKQAVLRASVCTSQKLMVSNLLK